MNKQREKLVKGFLARHWLHDGDTVYVSSDATGDGTGSSWANAYTSMSNAVANGKKIFVADDHVEHVIGNSTFIDCDFHHTRKCKGK